jgi:hypothetical protein
MTTDGLEGGMPLGLPASHIEAFLEDLRGAGYAERTIRKKRSVVTAFTRWTKRERIALDRLGDCDIAAFVKRSSETPAERVQFEMAALRPLLEYLRAQSVVVLPLTPIDASPADELNEAVPGLPAPGSRTGGELASRVRASDS